jgi:hypothetical protein
MLHSCKITACPSIMIYPASSLQTVLISYFFLPKSFTTSTYPITSSPIDTSFLKSIDWLKYMLRGKLLPIILENKHPKNHLLTVYELLITSP